MQDMQRSPFAVVDEINQGMDHENERSVFSRIVLNSCGPDRKQYFLITPKLLQVGVSPRGESSQPMSLRVGLIWPAQISYSCSTCTE